MFSVRSTRRIERQVPRHSLLKSSVFALGLFGAANALAVEMPTRKAGLWEMTVMLPGADQTRSMVVQQCTDATTDKDMSTAFGPMTKDMCSKQDVQRTPTGMTIDSTCTSAGVTSNSRIVVDGDLNWAYTVKITGSGGPAGKAPRDVETTMNAKWIGACKADQKPGDMIMPGGIKMNIKDMPGMMKGGK